MRSARESVVTTRAVRVERVPDGTPLEVPSGTAVQVTQALGSSFTLLVGGQLVRLGGADADAIGRPPPAGIDIPADAGPDDVRDLVWQTLRTCYDPEIPVDIVELGLVYDCDLERLDDGRRKVNVRMTLTAPGCGMGEILVDDVRTKIEMIPTVAEADVDLVFDPPWNQSMMSEAARLETGML